jgi:hypothetical protein
MMGKTRSREDSERVRFSDFLVATSLLFCNDALSSDDGSVSLIRLIDQLVVPSFPFLIPRLYIVAELRRKLDRPIHHYQSAELKYGLRLKNPAGEIIDLGTFLPGDLVEHQPWFVNRLILNLSNGLTLMAPGTYTFILVGGVGSESLDDLVSADLVVNRMSPIDGLYHGQWILDGEVVGEGMVQLRQGHLSGNDMSFQWNGAYSLKEDAISASATIRRFAPGPSIFDLDACDLQMIGQVHPDHSIELVADCSQSDVKLAIKLRKVEHRAPNAG